MINRPQGLAPIVGEWEEITGESKSQAGRPRKRSKEMVLRKMQGIENELGLRTAYTSVNEKEQEEAFQYGLIAMLGKASLFGAHEWSVLNTIDTGDTKATVRHMGAGRYVFEVFHKGLRYQFQYEKLQKAVRRLKDSLHKIVKGGAL